MEVWVRSQDKEIFSVVRDVRFTTMKKHKLAENKSTINTFVAVDDAYCIECNLEFFGEYPTKERCLEIIDEIQSLLFSNFCIIRNCEVDEYVSEYLKPTKAVVYSAENKTPSIEYHEQSVVVYEMPKE